MMKHLLTKLLKLCGKPNCTFCRKQATVSYYRVYGYPNDLQIIKHFCCDKHAATEQEYGWGDFDTKGAAELFIITETLCNPTQN